MKWRSTEEIGNIYSILQSFLHEYNDYLMKIRWTLDKQDWYFSKESKIQALWEVVDNVKAIFDNIVDKRKWDSNFEWFKFNESDAVTREWNDIIISGTFNWKDIKVRYDLNSWW
jgi:hypothetical protein